MNRKAYVAGHFYPRRADELTRELTNLLEHAPDYFGKALGIIVPHAGYLYSGQCAAYGYKTFYGENIERIILIAPSHISNHIAFSVGDYNFYETPLGKLKVDREGVETLLSHEGFIFDPMLHEREHSMEVQLPFIKMVAPEAKIIPVIFANQTLNNSKILAEKIFDLYSKDRERTKIVISTDLSHYFPVDLAEKKDNIFINLVLSGNIEALLDAKSLGKCEACGMGGVLTLMQIAREVKKAKFRKLCYSNSGQINKDYDNVVGYTSIVMESLVDDNE